ncbi:MAG: hypothetical protein AAFR61_01250 [Bacteroidota bacterium]
MKYPSLLILLACFCLACGQDADAEKSAQSAEHGASGPLAQVVNQTEEKPGLAGTYTGDIQGTPASLVFEQKGTALSGELKDQSGYTYYLEGQAEGLSGTGKLTDSQTGTKLDFETSLEGSQLSFTFYTYNQFTGERQPFHLQFTRANGQAPAQTQAQSQGGGGDNRLVGTWRTTSSQTSGSFSMVSETYLQVFGNGTYFYGNSRVVGGGGAGSFDSGSDGSGTRGKWKTQGEQILISEEGSGFYPFARYYIEGYKMMLTYGNGEREIWNKIE